MSLSDLTEFFPLFCPCEDRNLYTKFTIRSNYKRNENETDIYEAQFATKINLSLVNSEKLSAYSIEDSMHLGPVHNSVRNEKVANSTKFHVHYVNGILSP